MKQIFFLLFSGFCLAGCAQLDSIPYSPPQTSTSWLAIQPSIKLDLFSNSVYLIQPSTTAIVYFLGVLTLAAGLYFLRIRAQQQTRLWWGIALLLWGAGALLAGTSYEAFSYSIKCAGRDACVWTSGWEIIYLIFSVGSVDAMLIALAYSSALGRWRKNLIVCAIVSFALYLVAVLIGTLVPVKFLISFEFLILVLAPNIVLFLILNGWRYRQFKQPLDLALLGTWIGLIVVIAAYFGYYISGFSQTLWQQGIWFTENDVLHIGLIVWMLYIARVVARMASDAKTSPAESSG